MSRVSGRPLLYTSYGSEMALLNTRTKQVAVASLLVLGAVTPLAIPDEFLNTLVRCCIVAIGAIGLNLVTGYAGQVSLGHAFFIAVGAYTAAVISGDPARSTYGLGITNLLVWLPAAGIVAAAAGILVAPLATRLRGLYLAIVTLGLVFIGEHIFNEWRRLTGGAGIGRPAPLPELFGVRLDVPGAFTKDQQMFWLMLALLVIFAVAARNIARSRVGRAFNAIRDRDIAAGVMGVSLVRYKTVAFAISSFYAGCAGALLVSNAGYFTPSDFDLELSVLFVAMVLIGGAGTISGAIMGAFFVTLLPVFTSRVVPVVLPFIGTDPTDVPSVYQVDLVLYGALIIVFLIFEPRGLFGIWLRVRNYWKAWPFSY